MPGNFKKEDLRIIKTRKALSSALYTLLRSQSFNKITVFDICAEALVSRTAFYMHFRDKYDLLEYCLNETRKSIAEKFGCYSSGTTESLVYGIFKEHIAILANLLDDADKEATNLIINFLTPRIDASAALGEFLAGGLYNVIMNSVKNFKKLSEGEATAEIGYLYNMIMAIAAWDKGAAKLEATGGAR